MNFDFIIVGAGIAGAAAAFELSRYGRVGLLEREARPAYHTTGRSAAFFTINYGNRAIRALTKASESFLTDPPDGFSEHALLTRRGILTIARADQMASFEANLAHARATAEDITPLPMSEAIKLLPVLRPNYLAAAHLEPGAMYMDVDLIHRGYLRGMSARGGRLLCDAEIMALAWSGKTWRVKTAAGDFEAPVVVNAAGAWADEIAAIAGLGRIGLVPKRRTVIIFANDSGIAIESSPMAIDVDEQFYFKPEAGKVLASPADETPSPPCDAQPEEIDVALTVERIERATVFRVGRIEHKWAGLRSFVADRGLVIGADAAAPGFIWLAGQGGYGIMTSPAAARALAALATGSVWPADLAALGLNPNDLSPARLMADADNP